MKENGTIAKISKFLRKENNLQLAIVAVAAVALIAFILTTLTGNTNGQPDTSTDEGSQNAATQNTSETLGTRLERILSQVESAGKVSVLITYETGPEIVPAVKTDKQSNSSNDGTEQTNSTTSTTQDSEPVVVQGKNGTEPMVLMTKEPVVLGVLVVAEGASELDVRLRLMQAVQVALQIAPDRIEVLPMNISNSREGK
jgi:stage III sporulation protein AG